MGYYDLTMVSATVEIIALSPVLLALLIIGVFAYIYVRRRRERQVSVAESDIRSRAHIAMPIGGKDYIARDPVSDMMETGPTEDKALRELIDAVQEKYS